MSLSCACVFKESMNEVPVYSSILSSSYPPLFYIIYSITCDYWLILTFFIIPAGWGILVIDFSRFPFIHLSIYTLAAVWAPLLWIRIRIMLLRYIYLSLLYTLDGGRDGDGDYELGWSLCFYVIKIRPGFYFFLFLAVLSSLEQNWVYVDFLLLSFLFFLLLFDVLLAESRLELV